MNVDRTDDDAYVVKRHDAYGAMPVRVHDSYRLVLDAVTSALVNNMCVTVTHRDRDVTDQFVRQATADIAAVRASRA